MNRENVVVILDEKKFMHRDDRLIILLRHVLRTPTYSLKDIIGNRSPNESNFFQYPCDVIVDERRSLLFVSDCGELNIQVFDLRSREFMYNIKTNDRPRFMALYCDSLIFSSEDGFIYRFDLETRSEIWKSNQQMSNPCGVIVDEMDGLVFVCECGSHSIRILSAETGKRTKQEISLNSKKTSIFSSFSRNETADTTVSFPYGIAFSLDRNHLVVSSVVDAKIHLINFNGKVVKSFGEPGSKPNQFNFPSSLIVDQNNGNILVCDRNNNRIGVFTSSGGFLKSFGNLAPLNSKEALYQPRGLCIDHASGDLFVTDYGQDRICVYSQFN